ncbi:MAG: type II toxin-antitoxin system VapC family toxin [Propionibacteriaceae bacterium]|nr:type II toxin-antitoxin system VapC family toxin [Propionibacteriaceae bacterium]
MTLVVDASALAEFLVGSPRGVAVASALARDPQRHLPHLAIVETMSVMRRWARTGQVTEPRARAALTDLADFPASRWSIEPLLPRIWELRDNLSAYDASYVALAEALEATLLTADARLERALRGVSDCMIELIS